jgi:branched-subunit amino acid ABC-type transport system permease component
VAARRVRAAVRHDPQAKPMAALVIARCVALGKASSTVGAAVAGFATGLLARLIPDVGRIDIAAHEVAVTALLLAAALLVAAGGLVLERAGIDPNRDRTEH